MLATRSDRLQQIIDRRRSLVDGILTSETKFLNVKEKLRDLETHRRQLLSEIQHQDSATHIQDRLKELNFDDSITQIDILLQVLDNLKHRFDRSTFNIGVVGRMRQGKSTLLQQLSGLTDREIPAQKGAACTAVRSIIYHHDGDTKVNVIFHSEKSLLEEVIQQYWKSLNLPNCPDSLDSFDRSPLPIPTTAVERSMYKNLLEYKDHLGKYRPLLAANRPNKESIAVDEISKYVTHQRNGEQELVSCEFLAVKQVEIYCRFSQSDLGQLALIDVPGLGDTKLGDESLLLNTLGREVDLILFVRRPDPMGDQWKKEEDIGLYDTANEQLKQLSERAFMVLNHTASTSENLDDCHRFQQTMNEMKVVDSFIVNCFDREAVSQQILEPIVQYALNGDRLFELDKAHLNSILTPSYDRLYSQVETQLILAKKVFGEVKEGDLDFEKVDCLFDELWQNLRLGLQAALEKITIRRGEEDPALKKQIEETLRSCREDTGIPSLDEITKDLLAHKREPNTLYERYINDMRLRLSQKFISLDVGLKDSLDRVKEEIGSVLANEGRLENLAPEVNSDFASHISEQIAEDLVDLKKVFTTFAGFNLLYRGMIQHRIRPELDRITPGGKKYYPLSESPTAEKIKESLDGMYTETLYHCEQQLKGILREPSEAVFAIAEEFIDGLLWSQATKRQYKFFVQRNRTKIWAEDFKPDRGRLQWQKLVDAATDAYQTPKIDLN